jgi:hypothetical protein
MGTTIKCLSGAAGIGLGTTIKYLRRTTSSVAGNGLGTAIKYLRGAAGIGRAPQSSSCDAQRENGMGTAIKYLQHTTSVAAGIGLGRYRGLLICQFATRAPHLTFFCACLRRQQAE